jgi:hypothetical protein
MAGSFYGVRRLILELQELGLEGPGKILLQRLRPGRKVATRELSER